MDLRRILSIIGRLAGMTRLSRASRTMAQVARKLRPRHSIHIVGPPEAGKTTLFRYLRHEPLLDTPARPLSRPRARRIAFDLSGTETYFFLSTIPDEVLGKRASGWAKLIIKYKPHGIIFIIDTHNPEEDQIYFHELYNMYREFSTHKKHVNLRVVLILLNKFDLWGSTAEAREEMMNRYRSDVFHEVVNRFRSSFGVTVQFGYASLTHREHTPYNNIILKEFLMALEKKA
jgi:predicted transcriptional regulator